MGSLEVTRLGRCMAVSTALFFVVSLSLPTEPAVKKMMMPFVA